MPRLCLSANETECPRNYQLSRIYQFPLCFTVSFWKAVSASRACARARVTHEPYLRHEAGKNVGETPEGWNSDVAVNLALRYRRQYTLVGEKVTL